MRKLKKDEKVIVAMSGGVDSSVTAALLKRAGFNVTGVFMKLYDSPRFKNSEKRAKKIAEILEIPFLSLDLQKEFKKKVIDCFLAEYKKARTPNPCVVCNKEIKFGLLLEKILSLGADFIATGHYARLKKEGNKIHLLRGKDKEKDQSYFLWRLNQEQLRHVMFPLGNYTKQEVRELAKKFKLPIFEISESQEICFIQTTINDFLKKHLKTKPGPIVEQVHYGARKIVGKHEGLWFYTIGQRKGIELAGGPYYVLDKDLKKNLLIVTKNEKDLYKKELIAKDVNWISGKESVLPLKVKAKIRYRHELTSGTLNYPQKPKIYHLIFERSQRAVTPGQSVVFFKRGEVLGGGIIKKSLSLGNN